MTKGIICADIHIYDYPQYNFEKDFRLKQFINLAYRIIEIGKQEGATRCFLLGDTIHKPIITPKVAHYASEFFEILSTYFSEIYYILGQHCTDSKSESFLESDSLVPILGKHTKAIYSNKKIIEIDGKIIALCNWELNTDWSFIDGKNVDVFMGHLTLDDKFGQYYNDSGYKLGFFGDIHQKKSFGKNHTVNVPIPHYISDCQDGSVICIDFKDLSWKRISTESNNFQYLKMYYDDELPKHYNSELTAIVTKPEITETINKIYKSLDIDSMIKKVIDENNLKQLHDEIIKEVDLNKIDTNFDFKLSKISIKNFRSIKSLNYDFIKSGTTLITGHNGSGKSSLMRAIHFIFCPPRQVKPLIKSGRKSMNVELSLFYENCKYIISRGVESGSSYLDITIIKNGEKEELKSNSLSGMTKILEERLPFVKLFDIFYRNQESSHILDDYNYADRINLISNILNINIVEKLHNVAKSKLSLKNDNIKKIKIEMDTLENIINLLIDEDISNVKSEVKSVQSEIEKFKLQENYKRSTLEKYITYEGLIQKLNQLKSNIDLLSNNMPEKLNFKEVVEGLNVSLDKSSIKLKDVQEDKLEASNRVVSLKDTIQKLESEIINNEKEVENIKSKIDSLSIGNCFTCNQPINEKDINNLKLTLEEKHKFLDGNIIDNKSKLYKIKTPYSELKEKVEALLKEETSLLDIIREIKFDIKSYTASKDQYEKYYDLLSKYDSLEKEIKLFIENNNIDTNLFSNDIRKDIESILSIYNEQNIKLTQLNNKIEEAKKHEGIKKKYSLLSSEIDILFKDKENLDKYIKLFSDKGAIIQSVFLEVSKIMSTNDIKVSTVKTLSNGDTKIDFNINYKVGKNLIPYSELSGGQKTLVDIFFLCKLYAISGRVGLLMLDETLSDLDGENLEFTMKNLNDSSINNIFVVSHLDSFNYFDSRILVKLLNENSTFQIN